MTPDIERTTVHVSDDTGRIAMLEVLNDAYGSDGALPVLSRYAYSDYDNANSHRSYGLSINSNIVNEFNNIWRKCCYQIFAVAVQCVA